MLRWLTLSLLARRCSPSGFREPQTLRSGEEVALGADLLGLVEPLKIERAVLGGYNWGEGGLRRRGAGV